MGVKIYIDNEVECMYDSPLDMGYDDFVITGNRDFLSYHTNVDWYERSVGVLMELDEHAAHYVGHTLAEYDSTLTRAQRLALIKVYDECPRIMDIDTIAAVANILYPDRCFKTATIRGCMQSEWQTVVYDSTRENDLKYVEAYYFGEVSELCIDDDGDTCFCYVPKFELWEHEKDSTVKEFALTRFDYEPDTPCEVYVSDGYTRTKVWKKED